MRAISILAVVFSLISSLQGQTASDVAVQLSVTTQTSPAEITLHWPTNATTNGYQVYRKLKAATSWGPVLINLTGSTTQYTDNNVTPGVSYEYWVFRSGSGYSGNGYINCGIEVPETEFRGKLILVADSTFISTLDPELKRLTDDMEGDGWEVTRLDVDRNSTVLNVHGKIVAEYTKDPVNTKAVFLFGHVPVPYSGNLNPDAHSDHLGAWPADVFYGDMNGTWTDSFVASTTASPLRTQNNPGDGKFDQSLVPGDVELQVGRVDLSSLPSFSNTGTEEQLLRNYLDKDHEYRKKIWVPQKRAVIDDNFGYFSGEAFASSGYRNFAPLVGTSNITAADYITSLNAGSYLWSYGCGGGSFTSASGIGNTSNIATSTLQGVFTMLFGSYFGDWDITNNFLRAPLANGKTLTNVWSGRPHFYFHHMALGENIGYSIMQTQNFSGPMYFASPFTISGKWVHNALMGDPTLRNDVVAPVADVVATRAGFHCNVSWTKSPDPAVLGYHLYRKNDSVTSYVRVNSIAITDTFYTDSCMWYPGVYKYMVRALKLENTPSGTYYNLSEGIADTALNTLNPDAIASFSVIQAANTLTFVNTSSGPGTFLWDDGNGNFSGNTNFTTTYSGNGNFLVTLVQTNECDTDTFTQVVAVVGVGLKLNQPAAEITIYPNPARNLATLASRHNGTISIRNNLGQLFHSAEKHDDELTIDLSEFAPGIYSVELLCEGRRYVVRLQKD